MFSEGTNMQCVGGDDITLYTSTVQMKMCYREHTLTKKKKLTCNFMIEQISKITLTDIYCDKQLIDFSIYPIATTNNS